MLFPIPINFEQSNVSVNIFTQSPVHILPRPKRVFKPHEQNTESMLLLE